MDGYEVFSPDDEKLGTVVEERGDYLIVEHGRLLHTRHAVPKELTQVLPDEGIVRTTISKELFEDSPKVSADDWDEQASAEHYGLAAGVPGPETAGEGELLPGDPGLSAEQEELRTGVEPAPAERVRIREHLQGGERGPDSPGLLGERHNWGR